MKRSGFTKIKSEIYDITLILRDYQSVLLKNKWLLIYSIIITFFSFGYELLNFSLSIDEELATITYHTINATYLVNGRWGIALLKYLNPEILLPYYPFVISLLLIALSSFLFMAGEKGNMRDKLVFSVIFISCPIHVHYLIFNILNMYMGIGTVVAVLAYHTFREAEKDEKARITLYFITVSLVTFLIALYQSLLAFFAVLAVYHLFDTWQNNDAIPLKKLIMKAVRLAGVMVVAVMLFKLVDYCIQYLWMGIIPGTTNNYLENFIGWGKAPVSEVINSIENTIYNFLRLNRNLSGYTNLLIWSAMPVLMYFSLKKRPGMMNTLVSFILLVLMVISPFMLILLTGKGLPFRTMVALPLMFSIIWWQVYWHAAPFLRTGLLTITLIALINNTYINTRIFYGANNSWMADRALANRIYQRIIELDPPVRNNEIKATFFGKFQTTRNPNFVKAGVSGASFFEWDNLEMKFRIDAFYKTCGITNLRLIPVSRSGIPVDSLNQMPVWPQKGSVKLINGVVAVKLNQNWEIKK